MSRSKIDRLPEPIRAQLCQRLLDGQAAPQILPWLNSLPEAKTVIAEMPTAGGHPVGDFDDKNLSQWRNGAFKRWLDHRDRIAQTRELASYSIKLARAAGGNISEGASAMLAGQLMEILESLRDLRETTDASDPSDTSDPSAPPAPPDPTTRLQSLAKAVDSVSKAIASVRAGDHNAAKLDLERQRVAQSQQTLELEQKKFQRLTCELFIKWYEDKRALEAVTSPADNSTKIERLGQIMFGEDWKPSSGYGVPASAGSP